MAEVEARSCTPETVSFLERPLRTCLRPLQTVMVRTGASPLRFVWRQAYKVLIRAVLAWIQWVSPGATVYCRGGFARRDVSYGLSDLDLVIAVPEGQQTAVKKPVEKLYARLPLAKDIVEITVASRRQLARSFGAPFQAWPADGGESLLRAAWIPAAGANLCGPLREWRVLSGDDVLPADDGAWDADLRAVWSWTELQFIWKHTFRNCADPGHRHTSRNLAKSVMELALIAHWALHGEILPRAAAQSGSRDVYPEEQEVLEFVRRLRASLHREPETPLERVIPYLCRTSARLAGWMEKQAWSAGATWVRLVGEPPLSPLPLLDWRSRTLPGLPEEHFVLTPGDIEDPAVIAAVAKAENGSPYPALVSGSLMLLPTNRRGSPDCGLGSSPRPSPSSFVPLSTAAFRAIQCPETDPVSFALMAGERGARFPEIRGWSVGHAAARGVAEFRSWMENPAPVQPGHRLGVLFAAARVAILWETAREGAPELAITHEALASRFGEESQEALDLYLQWRTNGSEPRSQAVERFLKLVLGLAAYREKTN